MKAKTFLLLVAAVAIIIAPLAAHFWLPRDAAAELTGAVGALRGMGLAGGCIFMALVCLLALIGIVPGALLGIAAGGLYGVFIGFLTGAIGVLAGAIIAFALSRSVMRPLIVSALGKRARLAVLDQMVTREKWKIVFLLRISPVMPFSLTSYALGLSGIAMRDYFIGTLAAMPPLLGYVIIGALSASTLAAKSRGVAAAHIVLFGVGIIATLALTVHISRLLARAMRAA